MRISNHLLYSNIESRLGSNLEKIMQSQTMISTGKKYILPSDDPIVAINSMKLKNQIAISSFYGQKQEYVKPFVQTQDNSLSQITESIRSIKVELNMAANATTMDTDLDTIAANIDKKIDSIIAAANSQYDNTYLFGGYNTQDASFTRSGDLVYYHGTSQSIQQEIGKNTSADITLAGNRVFESHSVTATEGLSSATAPLNTVLSSVPAGNRFSIQVGTGTAVDFTVNYAMDGLQDIADKINSVPALNAHAYVIERDNLFYLQIDSKIVGEPGEMTILDDTDNAGGANDGLLKAIGVADNAGITGTETSFANGLFDTLIEIKNQIAVHNRSAIPAAVDRINSAYEQILQTQFNRGSEMQRLEKAQEYSTVETLQLKELLSDNEGVDLAQALTELSSRQNAYEAALATSSKIMNMSLLNYL